MADKTDPIRAHPHRDPVSGQVFHVRVELVFGGVKRYEVYLKEPSSRAKLRPGQHFGGLRRYNEQNYDDAGCPSPEGVDLKPYRQSIIRQVWAIIKQGKEKSQASANGQ